MSKTRLSGATTLPMRCGGVAVLVLLAGCLHMRSIPLGADRFAPRPADYPLEVYADLADVGRSFVKVGYIEAKGDDLFRDVFGAVFVEARRLGADALVLQQRRGHDHCDSDETATVLALRYQSEEGEEGEEPRRGEEPGSGDA